MNNQENKQLIMQAYQLFKNKDIQGLLSLCTDDIEWIGNESEYVPFAGSYHGKDQVADFFTKMGQAQEPIQFEPQTFVAEDDKVFVAGNSIWHVKSTGQQYESPWAHVFTIRDGNIAGFQHYNDTAAADAAFRPAQTSTQQTTTPMHH
jgi:ketosteroid isomerase-like protein